MSQTLQEKNKALLLEGFDVLFNKRDFVGTEGVLVAELHPAQLTYRTGQRWIVQSSQITGRWIQMGARHHDG
jgi:hypothetical protein